ncbi:MAG: hypothetical protein V3S44_00435, partial [Alphaproteobacteria bacterium]
RVVILPFQVAFTRKVAAMKKPGNSQDRQRGVSIPIRAMLIGVVLCVLPLTSFAAGGAEFGQHVRSLYGFSPHTLDSAQIDAKSAELDEFWSMVEKDPKRYLPLLRAELARDGNPSFFHYDGSKLLLYLSKSAGDKKLALTAIPRGDLRDIQHTDYMLTVHSLAVEGYDTSEAAFRILAYPEFSAFIVQHVLTLGQDYAFIYMLLPVKEQYYLPKALARLRRESDPVALESLLKLLWYSDTADADAAIEWASTADRLPRDVRKLAADMVEQLRKARRAAKGGSAADYDTLREKRRKRMRSVSDEALLELDEMTIRMKAMRK